ncbi:MAG TPA: hemerythrin domain-containing protein [Planctomycetota bacterium]|nr:hemerythrin domain-containing protein [Planctomycetota bacterium]
MRPIQTQAQAGVAPAPQGKCCGHHDAFAILHDCHEHILERLTRLETLGRELRGAQVIEERHLAVLADVLTFLDTAVPLHSADEEQTLFPRLREALGPSGGHTPMDCMEQEHVQHQALLAGLKRAVVKRDPAATGQAALAIVSVYREHIDKEESVLFPWARELLTDPVLVETMTQQMRQRRVAAGLLSC